MNAVSRITFVLVLLLSGLVGATAQTKPGRGVGVQAKTGAGEKRVALVIGNANYTHAAGLLNPVNDARDMTAALSKVGFEVISGENLSYQQMEEKVAAFGKKLSQGGVGLFFYAGHGIQADGKNYLVPVDAHLHSKTDLKFKTLAVEQVLSHMEESQNRLSLVILDACRNNPFRSFARSTQGGLAGMTGFPGQIYISYATAADSVASDGEGRNGLFTGELLRQLRTPGLELQKVFKNVRAAVHQKSQGKQVPFEYNSVVEDFYFTAPTNQSAPLRSAEAEAWDIVKTTRNPAVVRQFLTEYPNGQYASSARLLLTELEQRLENTPTKTSGSWMQTADKVFTLRGNIGWVETGIAVSAGQQVELRASGQIGLGAAGYTGPEGKSSLPVPRLLNSCATGAVLARIGASGELLCVGSKLAFTARAAGPLSLGVNVSNVRHNTDAFNVTVRIFSFQ